MILGFRGRKLGVRLFAILCISLFVVVIQILTVSRLSTPSRFPWEEEDLETLYHKPIEEEYRRGARNTLEEQLKPLTDEKNDHEGKQRTEQPAIRTFTNLSKPHLITKGVSDVLAGETHKTKKETDPPPQPSQSSPKPHPQCQPQAKDAISALERAKSADCKQKIHETVCLAQDNKLYNISIKNECPIGRNPAKQFQNVPYDQGQGPLPRIVFLMSMHGRAVRQVKRVFKAIYHSNHYYYIHVDYHSDYLYEELKLALKDYSNVYIPDWRMATIWGGASLLQMLLKALEDLEYLLTNWKWDYFINLSESDYPLRTNEELVQFLRVHRKFNFVKTHGGDIKKFIQKQGLDRTFVECDYHMWRIGSRQLPPDITIDGGSDWIVINRNYSHYLVTNQGPLLKGLKKYYEYSLLPAESFFHTVLRNGPLCNTLVRSNLRITNWNRKLGCRCQYKHIVDWCGCSPNDFLKKDLGKLKGPKDDQFFARKFEAIVNQNVISELDAHLYGKYPENTPGLNSYWESLYHHEFDATPSSSAHYTVYHSFMRLSSKLVISMENGNQSRSSGNCLIPVAPVVSEVHAHYQNDEFVGYVLRYQEEKANSNPSSIQFESLFVPVIHQLSGESDTCPKLRSSSIEVGSVWDGKESVFRNYGGILGVYDEPVVALRMKIGRLCHVDVFWVNPLGTVEQKNDLKLEPSATVAHQKLNLELPLMPGKWTVRLMSSSSLFIERRFVVFPVMFDKGKPLTEPSLVNGKHLSILKAGMDPQKYMEWRINILKKGIDLEEWLDKLVSEFWNLKPPCTYSSIVSTDGTCRTLHSCETSPWSTYYPDTKSELGPVNAVGRIR